MARHRFTRCGVCLFFASATGSPLLDPRYNLDAEWRPQIRSGQSETQPIECPGLHGPQSETTIHALLQSPSSMPIIDEEGRLFGTVNVVDALVVLLVLAVALAGIALVAGSGGPDQTRHATLELGQQPEYVVEQLSIGDTSNLTNAPGNLTITDTYVSPNGTQTRAVVRVRVAGQLDEEGTFTYGGDPLRLGRELDFETDQYAVNGTIQDVSNRTALPTRERSVIVRGTAPDDVATTIDDGSAITVADRTVGSVTDTVIYDAANDGQRSVYMALDIVTYGDDSDGEFGGTPVETGESIDVPVAGYRFTGTIARVGGDLARTNETVVVSSVVDAEIARAMGAGDTVDVAGETVATVEDLSVYGTENADRREVYATVSLATLGFSDPPRFGQSRVERGTTVRLDTLAYDFAGEITRLGGGPDPAEAATRTVDLELRNVDPDRAESLDAGLTETAGSRTLARVTDVEVSPATVVLTSESGDIFERQHPVNKDVNITADLQVRERDGRVMFKSRTIQEGSEVLLDLDTTTVRATVVDLDAE